MDYSGTWLPLWLDALPDAIHVTEENELNLPTVYCHRATTSKQQLLLQLLSIFI